MDTFSPIVITAKAAEDHLNKIKGYHADVVQGIQDQALRVSQNRAQQDAQKQITDQQNQAAQMESEKARMDAETKQMEAENKRKELEIKQQALSI